jgi:RimJ/RimL family protein N-acetyltransferase
MRNPIAVGERLYLRPLEEQDAEVMAAGSALEIETMMDRLRLPFSPIALANWIKKLSKEQPPDYISLGVCLKSDDRHIGIVELFELDYVDRTAETGSWINLPQDRGQGYGTEAKMLLLEYAFERLGLHALMSYVWEPNVRSAAALLKQGYKPAGRFKFEDVRDGVYRDGLLFDVLREDWLAAREALNARE